LATDDNLGGGVGISFTPPHSRLSNSNTKKTNEMASNYDEGGVHIHEHVFSFSSFSSSPSSSFSSSSSSSSPSPSTRHIDDNIDRLLTQKSDTKVLFFFFLFFFLKSVYFY
jgi:hypothetical protein